MNKYTWPDGTPKSQGPFQWKTGAPSVLGKKVAEAEVISRNSSARVATGVNKTITIGKRK
jgi:hypothetical protein